MDGRTRRLAAAVIFCVAALGGFSGSALAAAPSCSDGFTDPSGDAKDTELQVVNPMGVLDPVAIPGQANEDLLGGKVTADSDGGVSVTLTVSNLSKTVAPDATGESWYYGYTIDGGVPEFVDATSDGTNYVFEYGHIDPKTGSYTTAGNTSGTVTEGPNGTITLLLPDSGVGDTLDETYAVAFEDRGATIPGVGSAASLNPIDYAPDGGGEGGTNNPPCDVTAPPVA